MGVVAICFCLKCAIASGGDLWFLARLLMHKFLRARHIWRCSGWQLVRQNQWDREVGELSGELLGKWLELGAVQLAIGQGLVL